MTDEGTPPASPPPPFAAAGDEPADPAPAPGVVMPLTKEAIEKFLSCQLDTHLNDATPRQKERDRHEPEEQWKQPPTLQHHPSGGKSQHAKGPDAEQPAASVPGAVEEGNDEETKAKLEEQRVSLLQRRLADSEKQTKHLINRLAERNNGVVSRGQTESVLLPSKGAVGAGPSPLLPGAGHAHTSLRAGRGDRMKKNQLEQALLDSASRAKHRVAHRDGHSANGRDHSPDSDRRGVSREVSRVLNAKSERTGGPRSHKGRASLTGSDSQDGSADGDGSLVDGYSKSAAMDSVERAMSESDLVSAVGKKGRGKRGRQKNEDELPSVDETRTAVGRTSSGTEIDLETGLPREQAKSSFSWFYAISFVVLVIALVYASIIILNRYT